ncbi:homeobox-containing protein 1-like [Liolophura sinensis]|uniref:homeobox-containing protein 1-like n=1 Tax=Liolophura sinensis TaxID=3198878 RepID=UPI003158BF0C
MATTNHSVEHPLFTIEQIELIRRLRSSGISKEEVIHAFDALDRLDNELRVFSRPPANQNLSHKQTTNEQVGSGTPPGQVLGTQTSQRLTDACDVPGTYDLMEETCSNLSNTSSNDLNTLLGASTNSVRSSSVQVLSEDDTEEMKEFLKKGEEAVYEEIRSFVQQQHITQMQIATGSGLSQSYVSRYLRGDYCDMSERSCKAIYNWYLVVKKKTAVSTKPNPVMFHSITGSTSQGVTIVHTCPPQESILTSTPEAFPSLPQRRERFTFRPCHLEVLERFFTEDQYPSAEKREEISTACNMAVSTEVNGRVLTEREKVHPHIVANWFANRRKELKKMARDEGVLDASTLLLSGRSRWKPAPGELPRLEPSPLSDDNERSFVVDGTDEQTLSRAVEVAAVNQAILSLTGQTPSLGIKHELLNSNSDSFIVGHNGSIDI